jgi:hypothetical protein
MPTALANRFTHVAFETDIDSWVAWALVQGNGNSIPVADADFQTWAANQLKVNERIDHGDLPAIDIRVVAFLRFRPDLLSDFDPKRHMGSGIAKAFPSPRTWAFVSRLLSMDFAPNIQHELFSGTVGEGAAIEFTAFLAIMDQLPSIDLILMRPDDTPVPSDPSALYAVSCALAKKATDQTINNIVKYIGRMPAEFAVLTMRDALQVNPTLTDTRGYIEWSTANQNVLV